MSLNDARRTLAFGTRNCQTGTGKLCVSNLLIARTNEDFEHPESSGEVMRAKYIFGLLGKQGIAGKERLAAIGTPLGGPDDRRRDRR